MGKENKKELIQWHPAFRGAIKTELEDSKDIISYVDEKSIGKKELMIDLLIIKKTEDKMIKNPIGHIFKKHNIIEYKSPDDYLSINDFYKVYAYTCLYKSDEERTDTIGIDDLTISFVLSRFPREVVKHLKNNRNYKFLQYQEGIYHIIGDYFPIQIIVTSKLKTNEHKWLGILVSKVTKEQIRDVLLDYEVSAKNADKDAVIDIIVKINNQYFMKWKEDFIVSNELRKLFEPEIKQAVKQEVEQAVEQAVEKAVEQAVKLEVEKAVEQAVKLEVEKAVEQAEKETVELTRISQIRIKLQKDYDFNTISDHLELDIEYVKKIVNLIKENPNETDERLVKIIQFNKD